MPMAMPGPIRDLKFYDDAKMRPLREAFEREVLIWPNVSRKEMMGCLVYFRGRRMFAFLVNDGMVIMKLNREDAAAVAKRPGAKPFEMSGRTSSRMIQLSVKKTADLPGLLPYVRKGYDAAGA